MVTGFGDAFAGSTTGTLCQVGTKWDVFPESCQDLVGAVGITNGLPAAMEVSGSEGGRLYGHGRPSLGRQVYFGVRHS
jgi:hypothetical protein